MISSYLMILIMTPILLCLITAGYYIFVPKNFKKNPKTTYRSMFSLDTLPYLLSACFVYVLVKFQVVVTKFLRDGANTNYAKYILLIEGDTVSYFQSFATQC